MDVMGLIGTATGVVSLAILVAQEARHFGDMPAISSASSKYRTILENNGCARHPRRIVSARTAAAGPRSPGL